MLSRQKNFTGNVINAYTEVIIIQTVFVIIEKVSLQHCLVHIPQLETLPCEHLAPPLYKVAQVTRVSRPLTRFCNELHYNQ